jgi:GNAT superfamily N-acetyltransferase
MFDLPERETASVRFAAELPCDNEPWQIGLIVGPSGSGKTTIARAAYGRLDGARRWPRDRAVVDCFGRRSIKEITAMLTAVGFSSPPAWVKPYHVLSQGERFRCDLARALLTRKRRVVFDEFTSVVDRTVARIGAAAVAKAVRRTRCSSFGCQGNPCGHPGCQEKQFVAVTCHYDVAEWLEPDWVLDMGGADCQSAESLADWQSAPLRIQRVRLRRPSLRLHLHRTTADAWPLFARHHYLTAALNRSAHCYVALLDSNLGGTSLLGGTPLSFERRACLSADHALRKLRDVPPNTIHPTTPVALCAILNAIGYRGVWRVSRLVVLPDYQGIGIGRAMLAAVAELYPRLRITTGHPAMLRALSADPRWRLAALRRAGYTRQPDAVSHSGFRGGAIRSSSAGRCVATFEHIKNNREAVKVNSLGREP